MGEQKRPLILHADDSAFIIMTIRAMLEQLGCDCVSAPNGQEALRMARTQKPDAILLDAMMPALDGYQTAAALRADGATQNIPILMLTGSAAPKPPAQACGWVNDFLVKPVRFDSLKAALGALIKLPGGGQ
ncbi:MAG: hypothetical protein A3J74_11120 [Elusimicrobia bacterium RIFCSPHIGHO2_02_FULL_57_9]|nr:MAG: hypothetical protein A3J74_11120 [Elusimicrobia bacterium RIFCSPHIGHO2_02_FULL_57_9]